MQSVNGWIVINATAWKNKINFETTQTVKLNTKVQINIILENSSWQVGETITNAY
jgi:hypothetical protein